MFRIEPYRADMRNEVLALLGNKPHRVAIWDWQFNDSPFGRSAAPLVALDDGRVIGFNGVMPVDVVYSGALVQAVWSCDFIVDQAHRGQGIGGRIKKHQISQSPLILSLGISDMASPLLLNMGWRRSADVHVYSKVRKAASLPDQVQRGMQWVSKKLHPLGKPGRVRIRPVPSLPPPDQIDKVWQCVGPSYGKAVCRTGKYLHWKYGRHPLAQYRFILVEVDADLAGIGVLREDDTTLRFVDYVGDLDRPWLLRDLIRSMDHFFSGAHRLVCVASNPSLQTALLGAGFIRTRDEIRFYVRSSIAHDSNPETGWFIMAGDSDGELLDAARKGARRSDGALALVSDTPKT